MGIISLIFAAFLFSTFGVFTRYISTSAGVFFQLTFRVILMSLIFLCIGLFTKTIKAIKPSDLPLFIFRGVLIITDFTSFYFAINNLPLGIALFLFYAASILANFLVGHFVYHEIFTKIKLFGLLLAVLGIFLIYFSNFGHLNLIYSLFAIISGISFGLNMSTSKKLTDKYSVGQVNLVAYFTAAIIGLVLLFLSHESIPSRLPFGIYLALAGFAIVGVFAFYLTLYGYRLIEAQKASLILLLELVFVVIIGLIFYNEIPTIYTVFGGLLIITALALPNLKLKSFN